jgi:hypothetical protein
MDPKMINQLGHIRQQEILAWAAQQPPRQRWALWAWLTRIWQRPAGREAIERGAENYERGYDRLKRSQS